MAASEVRREEELGALSAQTRPPPEGWEERPNLWAGVLPAGLTDHTLPIGMFVTDEKANEKLMWLDVPEETREEVLKTSWAAWIEQQLRERIYKEVVEGILRTTRDRYEAELEQERRRFDERIQREQTRWARELGVPPTAEGSMEESSMEVVISKVHERFRNQQEACDEVIAKVKNECAEELIQIKAALLGARMQTDEVSSRLKEVQQALDVERARREVLEKDTDEACRRAVAPHLREKERLQQELESFGATVAQDLRKAWYSLGTTKWPTAFETTERQLSQKLAPFETGADWQFSEAQLIEEFSLAVGRGIRSSEELKLFVDNAVGKAQRPGGRSSAREAQPPEPDWESALSSEQRAQNRHFSKCATLATHCCLELLHAEHVAAQKRLMEARAGCGLGVGSSSRGGGSQDVGLSGLSLLTGRGGGSSPREELVGVAKYRQRRQERRAEEAAASLA